MGILEHPLPEVIVEFGSFQNTQDDRYSVWIVGRETTMFIPLAPKMVKRVS
jgi:hypothetical protein